MSEFTIGPVHHIRLTVNDVERSRNFYDKRGVPHGPIEDLPRFGLAVLPFRDPDGIQLELTAPM